MTSFSNNIDSQYREYVGGGSRKEEPSMARAYSQASSQMIQGLALTASINVDELFGDVGRYKMGEPAVADDKKRVAGSSSSGSSVEASMKDLTPKQEAFAQLKDKLGDDLPEDFTADSIPTDVAKDIVKGSIGEDDYADVVKALMDEESESSDKTKVALQKKEDSKGEEVQDEKTQDEQPDSPVLVAKP